MSDKTISVLLVEDNKLVKRMSVVILKELNCTVDTAETGQLALDSINKNSYDLIFVDLGLPDMNGFNVIYEIRSINLHVPIIALTAHSDQDYVQQSYKNGATDFIVKPLDHDISQMIIAKYVLPRE